MTFALLVIPLGAIVWVFLWNMGFNAPFVSFGLTAGAVALYRAGKKYRAARTAFRVLLVVILAAVALSFLSCLAANLPKALPFDPREAVTSAEFRDTSRANIIGTTELSTFYSGTCL